MCFTRVMLFKPEFRPGLLLDVPSCDDNEVKPTGAKLFQSLISALDWLDVHDTLSEEIFYLCSGFVFRPPVWILEG